MSNFQGLIKRLERLENLRPNNLTVLAKIDGNEKECTIDEFMRLPGAVFVRVLKGAYLPDVDSLLEWVGNLANE